MKRKTATIETTNNFRRETGSRTPLAAISIIVALCLFWTMLLAGCSSNSEKPADTNNPPATDQQAGETESSAQPSDSSDYSWRQLIKDYESWADAYLVFVEKYKENPTDPALLSDYAKLAEESAQWSEKVEAWDTNSLTPEEAAEYTEACNRISQKVLTASNLLLGG
ncbi:MAG: hypothetical protein FWG24_02025 [Eggerthellaceae bacterium]|jgi:hypothetical protein|nr:hypothetical protein [Eggerthellaceae bacterium]MDR2721993.1 hypothetical protein [Coriobacteriaceae bacterium]